MEPVKIDPLILGVIVFVAIVVMEVVRQVVVRLVGSVFSSRDVGDIEKLFDKYDKDIQERSASMKEMILAKIESLRKEVSDMRVALCDIKEKLQKLEVRMGKMEVIFELYRSCVSGEENDKSK